MSRLTELIDIDGMKIKVSKERPLSNQGLGEILHKLYALEDIEEDLGCPLDVVFKALKGISYEDGSEDFYPRPRLYYSDDLKCWCWELFFGGYVVPLKDHKKSWWLDKTKEE